MRICITMARPPSSSETFIRSHVERLAGQITVVHGSADRPFSDFGWFPVIEDSGRRIVPWSQELALRAANRIPEKARAFPRRPAEARLAAYFESGGFDVVLAEYGLSGVEVMGAAHQAGVPLAVVFHGHDAFRTEVVRTFRRRYLELFDVAERIVGGSRHMLDHLEEIGAPAAKLEYNQLGADTERFVGGRPAEVGPEFLAIGRLVEKKAPHLTIEAFSHVVQEHPEAKLQLAGEGPLRARCEHSIRSLGLENSVAILGETPHESMPGLVRDSRAVVQHSIEGPDGDSEGTAISVLEAGSAGVPVVATRHGGIAESIIHGETGFLVEPGDVAAMARYMSRLAGDPEGAKAMGAAAKERVHAQFSLRASIENLQRILTEASLSNPGSRIAAEPG